MIIDTKGPTILHLVTVVGTSLVAGKWIRSVSCRVAVGLGVGVVASLLSRNIGFEYELFWNLHIRDPIRAVLSGSIPTIGKILYNLAPWIISGIIAVIFILIDWRGIWRWVATSSAAASLMGPAPRRQFQFSLKAAFVSIAIAGVLFALTARWVQRIHHERYIVAKVRSLDGIVFFDDGRLSGISVGGKRGDEELLKAVTLLSTLDAITVVSLYDTDVDDAVISELANCPQLTDLNLEGTNVTDGCVAYIVQMRTLHRVNLSRTTISEGGIKKIRKELPRTEIIWDGGHLTP